MTILFTASEQKEVEDPSPQQGRSRNCYLPLVAWRTGSSKLLHRTAQVSEERERGKPEIFVVYLVLLEFIKYLIVGLFVSSFCTCGIKERGARIRPVFAKCVDWISHYK